MKGKNILLGITGGIAAYKAAILVRLLVKNGASVKVIMTKHAKEFVTPLTMATLSKNPILVEFYNPENGDWNSHVDLGLWADAYVIAPATANTMAKMAHGIADNLLLTTYLSARCPVFVAPTMDLDMYAHIATNKNMEILKQDGVRFIEPTSGELASGLVGKGRMEEPEEIYNQLAQYFKSQDLLSGKTFLITAGPTHEPIDPVRFIGNHSSGKMGFAIAETLAEMGAKVELIAGPVSIEVKHPNINRTDVQTAQQMFDTTTAKFAKVDGAIMCAAVADYKPESMFEQKVKHSDSEMVIKLVPNPDIAARLGKIKAQNQILVGFALETENETENAIKKIRKKNFDFIVLNSLKEKGAGFGFDTNKITIIDKNNNSEKFQLKSKKDVAVDIVKKIINLF